MFSVRPYRLFFLVLWGCVLLSEGAWAQTQTLNDIRVSFLKDTVIQSGSALTFNRVTIANQSSQKKVINVELDLPPNWSSPFGAAKVLELGSNAVLELPLRTAASNTTLSSMAYPITVKVTPAGSNTRILATYIARVQSNSKWNATLVSPEIKLDRFSRITYFRVHLTNSGNVDEDLSLAFRTGLELSLPEKNNEVKLKAASDTTIHIGIITDPRLLDAFKPQDIHIEVKDKSKGYKLLMQKVFSSNFVFRENATRWYDIPMYVELVGQNFTRPDQKQFYMNSAGSIALDGSRIIDYTLRSDNYYTYDSDVSSRYANVSYKTKNWQVSIGDQNEFSSFPIDGLGARIKHNTSKGYAIDFLGVDSRLGDARQYSLGQTLPLGKNSSINNFSLANFDRVAQTNSYSTRSEYESVVGRSTFQISAGYGAETVNKFGHNRFKTGPTVGVTYYYSSPRFVARSINNITSPNFAGMERGVKRSSSELRVMAKQLFVGAVIDYNSRSVSLVDSARLINLFGGRISEYGLRTGLQKGSQNFTVTASRVHQLQDSVSSIPFNSSKLSLNAGLMLFRMVNVSLSANYINSSAKGSHNIRPIDAFNGYGSVQTSGFGLSFRIDRGPFYYSDLMQYLNFGSAANRYQMSPYVERSFFKSALTSRVEVNYMKDMGFGSENLTARLDLNLDLKKKGVSLRFYGSHDFNRDDAGYLNLSVRKNFNMPLLGLRKYRSLKVVLFRDHNNNNVFDSGDTSIPDASLKIGAQSFTTNIAGEALYRNISGGDYTLELKQDDNVKGWIARDGFRQRILVDRSKTWFIPFKESRFLSGRINVVKDAYSKLTFNVASIRITAVNSKGEVFTTLTNGEGQFFMNLPGDTYLLQINNSVFTEEFRVLEGSFNVDLTEGNREDILFEVREKKRQMNIRRG